VTGSGSLFNGLLLDVARLLSDGAMLLLYVAMFLSHGYVSPWNGSGLPPHKKQGRNELWPGFVRL